MKCHYEVLDVSREATESDIKTAYRKLALKWHPDKNLDNPDFAKEQFQLVQQAYEVLSDRQERAWYDNHREQILRGSSSEFQDKSLDVFQYFTTTCFKGYGDDENGFYAVYRKVFDQITKEDMEFMEDKEEFCEIPSFGNSTTDYEKVSEFYAYWLNYSTKKSYVWLDPYDITDSRDRRYAKLAEKENKKVRLKAKKERNEEIRNLVAFVRKRDKRVQAQKKLQEQKLLEDKKKREELSKQKRRERQQELSKNAHQPEWAKFDNVKSELEKIERSLAEEFGEEFSNSDGDEEEEEEDNNLFCVACNKLFKTPKAFENHESSKRHKENVEVLKQIMAEEDEEIGSSISEDADEYNDMDKNSECLDKLVEDTVEDVISSDEGSIESIRKQKKKKKPRKVMNIRTSESDNIEDLSKDIQNEIDDLDFGSAKKSKKKNKKGVKEAKPKQELTTDVNREADHENINGESCDNEKVPAVKRKSKKDKKNKKEVDAINPDEVDISHTCVTYANTQKTSIEQHLENEKYFKNIEGNVLEISSGTGQHLAHFAPNFPKLTFQPSEFDTSLFPSIKAYAQDVPTKNVKEPVYIDAADDWKNWNVGNDFDYVINVNMIHVSPYSCTLGLFRNVSEILKPGGIMITYGAYANNGVIEPQSNIDFDKEIRRRNKEYGIRDIQDLIKLGKNYGIELTNIHDMPANNKCLVWKKAISRCGYINFHVVQNN
ncbi:unnamed protein product [Callosobruchus maculatus]|uniref:DnaJ homolog subfamily C member 21 n=1 Tax=Callosobruchus maculatus TaxID=64391 RepID=A0A653BW48_CALMS|nr:unnamed protein product [Callosobruchus maculatus]